MSTAYDFNLPKPPPLDFESHGPTVRRLAEIAQMVVEMDHASIVAVQGMSQAAAAEIERYRPLLAPEMVTALTAAYSGIGRIAVAMQSVHEAADALRTGEGYASLGELAAAFVGKEV